MPPPLLPILDKPILEHILDQISSEGCEQVTIVLSESPDEPSHANRIKAAEVLSRMMGWDAPTKVELLGIVQPGQGDIALRHRGMSDGACALKRPQFQT